MSAEIVSLEEYRMAHPREAILEILEGGHRLWIGSPDGKRTYFEQEFEGGIHLFQYDNIVESWKADNPNTVCIDF